MAICDYLNEEMVKRTCSLLTLIVLVLTQCFIPINYSLAENNAEEDFLVEENTIQDLDDGDSLGDDLEGEEGSEDDSLASSQDDEENVQDEENVETEGEIEDFLVSDSEGQEDIQNYDNVDGDENIEEGEAGSGVDSSVDLSDSEGQDDIQDKDSEDGEENIQEDEENTEESLEDKDGEKIIGVVTEKTHEIVDIIQYFFNKEGDSRYIKYGRDKNNIGTITLKDPKSGASITIMDKNLGAESAGVGKNSYGYYFQWGNNHGVKVVNSLDSTNQKAVYDDSYYNHGYDGHGDFIVGSTDYSEDGSHYNSLWGNESKESSRYGACPVGYHIPTIKEWNQLLDIWGKIHTQEVSLGETVLRYSSNYSTKDIHTFKGAATLCAQGDTQCIDENHLSIVAEVLSSELELPLAGSYDENGNFHDGLGVYWTTVSKNGSMAGVFDMDTYIGKRTDETLQYKAEGHNIRCFQNVQPYEAPVESEVQNSEENPEDSLVEPQNDGNNTQNSYSVKDIPQEYITYSLVLDTTKEVVNLELKANGGKFENDEETKILKYGYYNQEATIDVEALKQDEYRSGYEVEEGVENQLTIPVGYKLMDEIETPTREGYIFDGWYSNAEGGEKVDVEKVNIDDNSITENIQLYAHWIAKEYTITWKNEDGTIRDVTKVLYGQMPTHEDICQPADAHYSYTFAGWEPEIRVVDGDAEYRVKYTYTVNKYTVTWKNEDGTIIKTDEVEYGVTPVYDGVLPVKQSNGIYEYSFEGREPEVSEVIGNAVYVAKYSSQEIQTGNVVEIDSLINTQDEEGVLSGTEITEAGEIGGGNGGINEENEVIEIEDSLDDNSEGDENQGFFEELWETLKSFFLDDEDGYLRGSEIINDIVVSVEAEEGTFPEGTEVLIKGVPQQRLESIQSSLIEDESNNVGDDAEIVAFDISFVYSGEEIQPTKEVSVKFNYKENVYFQGASEKELSVYHIDDKTNEGEEVEVVSKNGDEIEILATDFSTYVVVAQKGLRNTPVSGRGIMDQMPDFIFNGITIYRPDSLSGSYQDSPAVYVVMDRNLGATSPGTICDTGSNVGTCGFLYQFGNNYGFSYGNIDMVEKYTGESVDLTLYSPSNPYYDSRFVRGNTTCSGSCDNRYWAVVRNNNIWGGKDGNHLERQGPCPDGWYVPTRQEWTEVVDYWNWTVGESNEGTGIVSNSNINAFRNYFQLPLGGERTRTDGILSKVGLQGNYFTTEPYNGNPYILRITTSNGIVNSDSTYNLVNGYSVRCFKNVNLEAYYTVTYNDGVEGEEIFPDQTGSVIFGSNYPEFTGSLEREGYEFLGWTESTGSDVIFDIENNRVIKDITLYAKWRPYYTVTYNDGVEGEEIFPDQTSSVKSGSNYPEFSGSIEREGYQFSGWTESGSDVIFDIENNKVIADITLYAKWRLICPDGEDVGPDDQCHTEAEIQRLNQIVVDLDLYYLVSDGSADNKQYTIMDRNMGATSVYNKNYTSPNNDSKGYLYQRGNNYGFPSVGNNLPGSVLTTGNKVPKSIWEDYVPSKYASKLYYKSSEEHGNWMADSTISDGIWGGTGDTYLADGIGTTLEGRQGPCPSGYHVPSTVEWQNLFDLYPGDETSSDLHNFTNDLLIPPVGRRSKNGTLGMPKALSYWSSSPSTDKDRAMGFYWDSGKVIERYQSDGRARARSIRCFKNIGSEFVSKEDIHLNGGTNVFISIHSGAILSLGTPTLTSAQLAQATFDGWYTSSDFSGNLLSTGDTISAGSSLYAKFTCNESGYIWNGSGCESGIRLYFDSMGGTEVPSQLIESGMTGTRPADPTKTGYVFSGWFLTGAVEEFDFTRTAITGETTVYAHWNTGKYEVSIVSNNEDYGTVDINSVTADYLTPISTSGNELTIGSTMITATPTADGSGCTYTFSGRTFNNCGSEGNYEVMPNCSIIANFESLLGTYTLDLVINTGIETIYYKINGADGFTTTGVTTTISGVEAGSIIYAYAEPKSGYTTDTSSTNLWSVTVTGNNVFSPEATASSVQYIVYHYVKKVGESGYALTQTETGYGITDSILELSGLAKSNIVCAHYDRGSLTGTEVGPGELVTQTTINGNGSTKIYLYYARNIRTVTLSGNEHVDYFEIGGEERSEAVRECGGEVPVNAEPKPGYHFVRWDREETRKRKNEEIPEV